MVAVFLTLAAGTILGALLGCHPSLVLYQTNNYPLVVPTP